MKKFKTLTKAESYLKAKYPTCFIDTGLYRGHIDIAVAIDESLSTEDTPVICEQVIFLSFQ